MTVGEIAAADENPHPRADLARPEQNLRVSLNDVDALLSFHEKAADPRKGKPSKDHSPLKRAAIVLVYAAWESFFENLLSEIAAAQTEHQAVDELPAPLQSVLLADLQLIVESKPRNKRTPSQILTEIVEYDWRVRLISLADEEVNGRPGEDAESSTYGINSADTKNVTRLLKKYCGEDLLATVAWAGMSNAQVVRKLDELVGLRGSVAHTGQLPDGVDMPLKRVREYATFVERVATRLVGKVKENLTAAPEGAAR